LQNEETLPRTVLLADDSVTAQNMGRRILTDAGYEVITVNNGSAALKKIHEVRPDLIVLDVYMPGYGGLEVCQRLKESGETSKIPVLLTVGKMEPFKSDEAKRVRADAHIVKPFEASELLAALTKLEDRIVPQAESTRGRKSRKPSFWHDEDRPAPRDRTDSEEAQANKDEDSELSAEAVGDRAADSAPKVGAFPLVPEATGELPVIADSNAFLEADEGAQVTGKATESLASATLEPMAVADSEPRPPKAPSESDGLLDDNGANKNPDLTLAESNNELQADAQPAESAGPTAGDTAPMPASARWIAENVALTPEEAAIELEQEMRSAENGHAEAAPAPQANTTPTADVPEIRGATFAAAAGAASTPATSVSAADEPGPGVAPEAAAAWENWQQIREAVMNVHSTAAIAESVAEVAKTGIAGAQPGKSQPSQEPQESQRSVTQEFLIAQSPSESPQSSDLEAGALASIVDTVLAELKPKLMEEIAKKLKK
jgi:CheY-like chemotaxis protein